MGVYYSRIFTRKVYLGASLEEVVKLFGPKKDPSLLWYRLEPSVAVG